MVDFTNTHKNKTTMGSGIKHTFQESSILNRISAPEYSSARESVKIVPSTSPNLRVSELDSSVTNFYGVEKAYNLTTGNDITSRIIEVADKYIYFDPLYVTHGDVIEATYYLNPSGWSGTERVSGTWVEQLYRHGTQLDRMDFCNYDPPFEWSLDNSNYDALGWAYHQRLFYNFSGWNHEDTRYNSSMDAGSPLMLSTRTILSWYPNSPSTVGVFVGDPAMDTIKGNNSKFTVQPIPFYLTGMTFFCKIKNDAYDTEKKTAIELNVTIDGVNDAMGTCPRYELASTERQIKSSFGDDNRLYLSFSDSMDYNGLPITYKNGRQLSSTDYNIVHKRIGCRASSLNVSARLLSVDADWDKVDEWYITFSGWLPYGYDTA